MARWNAATRLLFQAHTALYRLSGGRLGSHRQTPVLLLTTVGRKTGRRRTWPLGYLRDGANLVIVGSNGGKDVQPGWYWNLQAHPEAEVQVGRRRLCVRAEQAGAADEQRLWPRLVAQTPVWGTYRAKTARHLPIVILHPLGDSG